MAQWAACKKHAPVSMVVIHSHGHNNHTAARSDCESNRKVQLAVRYRSYRLGRPRHRRNSLPWAPRSQHRPLRSPDGNLMTGDSLYPGLLAVENTDVYTASSQRLTVLSPIIPWLMCSVLISSKELALSRLWPRHHLSDRRSTARANTRARIRAQRRLHLDGRDNTIVTMPDFTLVPVELRKLLTRRNCGPSRRSTDLAS